MKFLVDAQLPPALAAWLREGITSNGELRRWLIPRMSQIIECLERGDRLVEIR